MKFDRFCHRRFMGLAKPAAFILSIFCLSCMTGCGKESIVTLYDKKMTYEIAESTKKSVDEVLKEAGISVKEEDHLVLLRDGKEKQISKQAVLTGNAEVDIRRKHRVEILYKKNTEMVTLYGGTVGDAVRAAGVTLTEKEYVLQDPAAFLEDGQKITVISKKEILLSAGGEKKKIYTEAKTVGEFLKEQKLHKSIRVSPARLKSLKDGMTVTVKKVTKKLEVQYESIAFETVTKQSSSLKKGSSRVEQQGRNGKKKLTYRVTYLDGVRSDRELVEEKIIQQPVDHIVLKGTKEEKKIIKKKVVSDEYFDDCDGSGHGVRVITYSDGTKKKEEY